ncbi:MAG: PhnD/SsuA/transferrin family substrate-binding protein [Magnetococcales bacterium]|nr:PhnD/SsuA/transferrin family substrate-binding protein [Magnetococcales bacterium]MBF0150225.1 PhnD/SsuA/transferrin family substrate-binding protein [Magnetococcales bacterium]
MKMIHRLALAATVAFSLTTAAISPAHSADKGVKMVVTAAFVSDKGIKVYENLAAYLSKKMGGEVKVVSGISYAEVDEMLDNGVIQVGFVCGLPYTHKMAEGKIELVAIPVMALKKGAYPDVPGYEDVPGKYYSYTIVQKDSPLKSWADLKGKTYAFNDMGSNSGYNMPRAKLVQLGAKGWDYFSKVVVSGSHEESIRLVARGTVDASSVDSLVLDFDRSIKDPDALNVRVIESLHPGGAGAPPVVVSKKADPAIKTALQEALTGMHKDPEGQKILAEALVLRFDPPNDANYDDIRKMEKDAAAAGFKDHGN